MSSRSKSRAVYCIEGKFVTTLVMATILGITEAAVVGRLRKLKSEPGAITWAKLKGTK